VSSAPSLPDDAARREAQLVERARTGDEAAFEKLVLLTADRLYAVVLRFVADAQEAEEVVQETFLRAWRGIGRFDGRSRFFTWLYRIGINEAKRRGARRGARVTEVPLGDHPIEERADPAAAPAARAEAGETRRMLEAALRELPLHQRVPVVLRDVEGLTTSEAAAALGIRERAFKSRLHRARMALRVKMETRWED